MRHFYSTCVLVLDGNVEPHVLLTTYLPRPSETMRDISPRGSQHVDEEFGGGGWYSARSISRQMDYFPGCTYLPSKNPGTIEKKIS